MATLGFVAAVDSLVVASGSYSSCGTQLLTVVASRCRAWVLKCEGFSNCACGLNSCSLWTLEHRLCSCGAWA